MFYKRLAGAVAALAIAGAGLMLATPAQATDCQTVVHTSLDGITTVDDPVVELVEGGVKVTTSVFGDQGATWWQTVDPVPLTAVTHLSYQLHLHTPAVIDVALPAYLLQVRLADDTEHVLVFEPYYSGEWTTPGDVLDVDTVWDVAGYGGWWSSTDGLAGVGGGGSYASNQTLAEIGAAHEGIEVVAFGWRQEWAAGLVASVNHVQFAAGYACQKHAWKPPAPEPTPTVDPTVAPTVEPTTEPTDPPGVGGEADAQLPVTGASWLPIVGVGAVFLVAGVALMRALRRRNRPVFTLPAG